MPRVPEYNSPQVERAGYQPVYQSGRANADAFGAGIAEGIQRVGGAVAGGSDTLANVALQQQADDNARISKDLDNQLAAKLRDYFFGEDGFYNYKGEEAIARGARVASDVEKIRSEVAAGITNDRVRKNYDLISASRINQDLETSSRHVMTQRQVANTATSEVRIKEAIDDAAVGWTDPKILSRSQTIIDNEIADLAELNGWSPEVQASKAQEGRTAMYSAAIVSAIKADQVGQARKIFDRYKTYIDGPERADIEKSLRAEGKLGEAQKATDDIISAGGTFSEQLAAARRIKDPDLRQSVEAMVGNRQSEQGQLYNLERLLNTAERQREVQNHTDNIASSGASPEEMLAAARTIEDPEIRDNVEREVKNRISEADTIKNAAIAENAKEAFSAIYNGSSLSTWAKDNPVEYQTLTQSGPLMASLRAAENAAAEGRIYSTGTDGKTLESLRRLPASELSKVNPMQYRAQLTQEEYTQLNTLVSGASKSITEVQGNFAIFERGESYLRDMAPDNMNWGKDKQSKAQNELQKDALNQMNAFISGFTDRGVLPTPKDLQDEANRLMSPILSRARMSEPFDTLFGWAIGPDRGIAVEIARMSPEEKATVRFPIENIQPDAIEEAKTIFNKYGVEATDDNLEEFFGAQLTKDKNRQKRILGLVNTSDVSEEYVRKVSKVESGNNPNAKAKTSTATGLFQFTQSSWLDSVSQLAPEYGNNPDGTPKKREEILALRTNPTVATEVFKRFTASNGSSLEKSGIPTTDANMYLAHFLGTPSAKKVLLADDETPLSEVLSDKQIKANFFLDGKNVGWLKSWSRKKMAV